MTNGHLSYWWHRDGKGVFSPNAHSLCAGKATLAKREYLTRN